MEITSLTIKIIVLLLPGIFGMFLIEKLNKQKNTELRQYITDVIMLSFLSYLILHLSMKINNSLCNGSDQELTFFKSLVDNDMPIKFDEVFWSTFISIIVSLIITLIIFKGWFYSLFQKIRLTNSTGKDVWGELFHNNGDSINDYVYLIDVDKNITYGGEVIHYSNDSNNPELVIKNVLIEKDNMEMRCDRLYYNFNKNIKILVTNKEDEDKDEYKKNKRDRKKKN